MSELKGIPASDEQMEAAARFRQSLGVLMNVWLGMGVDYDVMLGVLAHVIGECTTPDATLEELKFVDQLVLNNMALGRQRMLMRDTAGSA